MFASKEENAVVIYDDVLVNKVFSRSTYTGLRDDVIRQDFRPLLEKCTTDEELLSGMTTISLRESERIEKFQRGGKAAKVTAVKESTIEPSEQAKGNLKEGSLITELKQLRAEVAALKATIDRKGSSSDNKSSFENSQRTNYARPNAPKRKPRRCSDCERDNCRCQHCCVVVVTISKQDAGQGPERRETTKGYAKGTSRNPAAA